MTLEEYYKEEEKIKAPKNMPWVEKGKFYTEEINKLRAKLSKEVLEEVLKRERHFEDKMQCPYY